MKVNELIEELQKFHPDQDVVFNDKNGIMGEMHLEKIQSIPNQVGLCRPSVHVFIDIPNYECACCV